MRLHVPWVGEKEWHSVLFQFIVPFEIRIVNNLRRFGLPPGWFGRVENGAQHVL